MNAFSWTHLADHAVDRELPARRARDCAEEAITLSLLAEFDARKRYVPAGYSSMSAYCLGVLGYSEDVAHKLINVARVARDFPLIFPALADGRLHKSGVLLLAPHLSVETAEELVAAATGKSKAQIERMLAERFPKVAMAASLDLDAAPANETAASAEPGNMSSPAPGRVNPADLSGEAPKLKPVLPRTRIVPLSAEYWALHATMTNAMREKLARAEDMVAHMLPSTDPMAILEHALDVMLTVAEKRKFGTTSRPRVPRAAKNVRTIPAAVRRQVSERDGRQCTFVSESGHRCEERSHLQYDHVPPLARGGTSTVDNVRLLCRAHNQYAAEQVFGAGFMKEKREAAQARSKPAAEPPAEDTDVIKGLRILGFSLALARQGAAVAARLPDASPEERMKAALRALAPARARKEQTATPERGADHSTGPHDAGAHDQPRPPML